MATNQFSELKLRGRKVRVDELGRICLNDIHRAGGFSKHQTPGDWTRLEVTKRLLATAIERITGNPVIGRK